MFSHVHLRASDLERAWAFYRRVLEPLGPVVELVDADRGWAGWRRPGEEHPLLLIGRLVDEADHAPGNGRMVAPLAPSRGAVRRCHATALELGATDEGGPGLCSEYHEACYGAYFRDLDGNRLCVCCHEAPRPPGDPRGRDSSGWTIEVRPATGADVGCLAALAVQVFLDTYATDGVRPDLAREAFSSGSIEAFERRLASGGGARTDVAVDGEHVLGFAETELVPRRPTFDAGPGAELARLYVQPRFQRRGIGRALLATAEGHARAAGLRTLWLTAWEGNTQALGFYARCGFEDIGETRHAFEDRSYGNRVLSKRIGREETVRGGA